MTALSAYAISLGRLERARERLIAYVVQAAQGRLPLSWVVKARREYDAAIQKVAEMEAGR